MKRKLPILAILLSLAGFTQAQTDSTQTQIQTQTQTETETETPSETKGTFTVSGYADTYYQYNTNKPLSRANRGRVFDVKHDNFSLGLVQAAATYTYSKMKVVADLTFGPNAELGNFGNTGTSINIKQAYGTYSFTNKLALTVGQFGTHIGYELIDAPLNYNYSLSYLFGNGPFYHTGAKLDYTVSDKIGLMVGVVNGWDALADFNDKKSVTAQVHLTPTTGLHVYANLISGDEYGGLSAFGQESGSRTNLYDLTLAYQVTESFKIGFNSAYGKFSTGYSQRITDEDINDAGSEEEAIFLAAEQPYSQDQNWKGAALYLNYNISDKFGLGFRAERFSDPSGVRYLSKFVGNEFTLTGDIKLAQGYFLWKPELRLDTSKDGFFENQNGQFNKKSQFTIGSAFIFVFNSAN